MLIPRKCAASTSDECGGNNPLRSLMEKVDAGMDVQAGGALAVEH